MKAILLISLVLFACSNLNGVHRLEKKDSTFIPEDYLRLDGYYYYEYKKKGDHIIYVYILYSNRSIFSRHYFVKNGTNFSLVELDSAILNHRDRVEGHSLANYTPIELIKNYGFFEAKKESINILYFVRAFTLFKEYDLIESKGVLLSDSTFRLIQNIDHTNDLYNGPTDELYRFRKLEKKPKPRLIDF